MKSFIVLALFVAAAVAAPAGSEADAETVKSSFDNIGVDGFYSAYETSNGISQESRGQVKNLGTENEALEITGQFSYPGPDGVLYRATYIANENGFQIQGDHIPK